MEEWKLGPRIGAAYIRVSSDDQLEYSPDSQLKVIRDYAKRDGYLIPDDLVFQDDGISGRSADKRPAFRLMIAQAKEDQHAFECIFVWKYSRFARNQEEAIMYKNILKKKGIAVKSISEPASDSPFSSLIERIIEWMDEYYLINLSGEVRRGMKEKATRGEALGRAPFGYRVENKQCFGDILFAMEDEKDPKRLLGSPPTPRVRNADGTRLSARLSCSWRSLSPAQIGAAARKAGLRQRGRRVFSDAR